MPIRTSNPIQRPFQKYKRPPTRPSHGTNHVTTETNQPDATDLAYPRPKSSRERTPSPPVDVPNDRLQGFRQDLSTLQTVYWDASDQSGFLTPVSPSSDGTSLLTHKSDDADAVSLNSDYSLSSTASRRYRSTGASAPHGVHLRVSSPLRMRQDDPDWLGRTECVVYKVTIKLKDPSLAKSTSRRPRTLVIHHRYSSFRRLHRHLSVLHDSIRLPHFPAKTLFHTDHTIRLRLRCFKNLMRFIAKRPELLFSPTCLDFLGMQNHFAQPHASPPTHATTWRPETPPTTNTTVEPITAPTYLKSISEEAESMERVMPAQARVDAHARRRASRAEEDDAMATMSLDTWLSQAAALLNPMVL